MLIANEKITSVEVPADAYKLAMRKIPAAVAVISAEHEGHRAGLTATAVCSVSAEPPQILACVNKSGRAHACVAGAKRFGVNFLSRGDEELAQLFASHGAQADDKFAGRNWAAGLTGVPLLDDALVALECELVQSIDAVTHTIYIGHIVGLRQRDELSLVYKAGNFVHI